MISVLVKFFKMKNKTREIPLRVIIIRIAPGQPKLKNCDRNVAIYSAIPPG
jgi:hypothetical protein